MENNIYDGLFPSEGEHPALDPSIKQKADLKRIYFDFLKDFKYYLAEFVRESLVELVIAEIPISTIPIRLFDGAYGGMRLTIKNQGVIACWLTTGAMGGYRLDPGEKQLLWLNKSVSVVTLSGSTTVGLLRT